MGARFHFLSPILRTKDLEQTISFYETILGFKKKTQFPNFVSLTRDNIELMFIQATGDTEDLRVTGSIYIFTEKVDELWDVVKEKAGIASGLCDREYMMRDFSILDNNGYELAFGEDISHKNV